METYAGQEHPQSVSPQALRPSELKRMIVKLRWIGLEHEAERLGTLLVESGHASSVLAIPRDTD
ncbi:MAG TPA: hypothetical protein VKY65_22350 [Alphaproteobacteria bacterium]|nr:hypothetical protein [Alphaproteobacteria bacterium]